MAMTSYWKTSQYPLDSLYQWLHHTRPGGFRRHKKYLFKEAIKKRNIIRVQLYRGPDGRSRDYQNFGANCLCDRSPVMLRKLHENPSKFFGVDPQKIRRVCMEFSEYNRLTSQRQFAPKCSFLVSRPLGHCSFRITWQIPQFQRFHFYDVITLVLY